MTHLQMLSSWSKVTRILQTKGYNVTAAQNPFDLMNYHLRRLNEVSAVSMDFLTNFSIRLCREPSCSAECGIGFEPEFQNLEPPVLNNKRKKQYENIDQEHCRAVQNVRDRKRNPRTATFGAQCLDEPTTRQCRGSSNANEASALERQRPPLHRFARTFRPN